MSSRSHHFGDIQRRVVRTLLAIVAIILVIGTPLVLLDELRLNVAHTLNLAPGKDTEQLFDADDNATLVVLPLGDYDGTGQERYTYRAQYLAQPVTDGTGLTNIETDETITIPQTELDFIAADGEGHHVLFRGPGADGAGEVSTLVTVANGTTEAIAEGETPAIPGDWETPTWSKTVGLCDRYSPASLYVACFNRADAASYLAGDWQIDVQIFGDFRNVEPVYRGSGFLPILGWANDDTWLYFQNEKGIWRIEIPESIQNAQSSE